MTVSQLIDELKKYPQDMPVACCGDIYYPPTAENNRIHVAEMLWVDSNYPYDKPEFTFLNLE